MSGDTDTTDPGDRFEGVRYVEGYAFPDWTNRVEGTCPSRGSATTWRSGPSTPGDVLQGWLVHELREAAA